MKLGALRDALIEAGASGEKAAAAAIQIERLRQEIRMENRKFFVLLIIAAAALFGTGIAIGHFFIR